VLEYALAIVGEVLVQTQPRQAPTQQARERRKATLAKLIRRAKTGLMLNEHIDEPGDVVFRHACKLGYEGIVSKRLGSPYRSGRFRDWIKSKNPAASPHR
jgi:ATP-dependent DNA ligase